MIGHDVDGLIWVPTANDPKLVKYLQSQRTPAVSIIRRLADNTIDTIVFEDFLGSQTATQHLIQLGHRRIGYIGGDIHQSSNHDRCHPATKDEFYRFFDPRFRRMPKALVLPQLPPKIRVTRVVEMSPKQRKAYNELNSQFLTWLGDGNVLTVATNLAKRLRLMQLASSHAEVTYDVEGDWTTSHVRLCEPSHKLDELEQVLTELGTSSVVVAAESRQLIMMAQKRLQTRGISTSLIVGGMTTYERDDNLRAFQERRTRVMLMTVKAGGTGLTMTAADTIIFLQRSDSMVDNKQAEDRVHRIGSEQHEVITVIDIVTADSVEVGQIRMINEKLLRLDEITRDRQRFIKNGIDTSDLDGEEYSILSFNLNSVR